MEHYTIALGVVVYNNKYLIGKRARTKKFAPGMWEFISGFVDAGETPAETILRELKEETTLTGTIVKEGSPYVFTDEYGSWKVIPLVISVTSAAFVKNPSDHEELLWVTNQELAKYPDLSNDVKELTTRGFL